MRNYLAVAAMGVFSTVALTSPLWADWVPASGTPVSISGPGGDGASARQPVVLAQGGLLLADRSVATWPIGRMEEGR